jgi:hypothetical protein
MSGKYILFTSLKRFLEPLLIKLANNSFIKAYRKGLIKLSLSIGYKLSLKEAWYIPKLRSVKLVLIICLNDQGYKVTFRPGKRVEARKDRRAIFIGLTQSGLVCLDLKPVSQTTAYTMTSIESTETKNQQRDKIDIWH